MGSCKRDEYKQMLFELRCIETDFFNEFNLSNIEQDLTFEQKKNYIAEAMKSFAIPRKLVLL